jgi:outer membrane biosynthesis protein TonB
MAGSFDIFRKYQRSMLAAVAILAMLAFFVLPPFLQMAPDVGAADPLVATWDGGGIREGQLQREVAMRMVLNQFLRDAMAASGRDPGDARVLAEDEADVVRTLLLAREAEANGVVIGNGAVNQFLAQWTNNMVRPEQLESLISGRRFGQMPVTTADVFAALRTVLAADRMRQLSFAGFAGDPPGARWDIFRRLEQEATIEVVPVVVESFAGDVPAPAEPALRALFDRFKDRLPVDRSPDPGFKEPHRISYDWLVANRADLEAAAEKDVTDAQIQDFYEENKVRLYRAKPTPPATEPAADPKDDSKPAEQKPAEQKPDAAADDPAESASEAEKEEKAEPKAESRRRSPFMTVKFRQPQPDAPPASAGAEAADVKGAGEPAAAATSAAAAPDAEGVEPLEKVRDDVRKRVAAAAVDRRIDGIYSAITADVAGFSRDLSRWKAESGSEASKPAPPDADKIAGTQGLKSGHAREQTSGEALRDGGVAASFQLSLDPRSPMGFRQAQWADLFFVLERPLWRPVETRDVPGSRFLTWKTADAPAFVPEFAAVRADVERAWRIVEARPLARKAAEELAAAATGGRTLAEVVKDRPGPKLEASNVGPFTWLAPGSGTMGSPATPSQPEGLAMPGEDLMRAVFALEPGGTTVAFNDPQTVCYVIRLVTYAPSAEDLKKKFLESTADQSRLGAVAEQEQARAFQSWLGGVEKRAGLEWKRPPQRP